MSARFNHFLIVTMQEHRSSLNAKLILFAGLCALTMALMGGSHATYIGVKAYAAQWLMQHAWQKALDRKEPVRPWGWADTRAAARISYTLGDGTESHSLIVLDNASGEAMAFGPGLVAGTLADFSTETIAIGGHRDTHLAFLEHASHETRFDLQIPDGRTLHYRFESSFVVDSSKQWLQIASDLPGLVLITCYPFNALQTGGPLRLVTRAVRVKA